MSSSPRECLLIHQTIHDDVPQLLGRLGQSWGDATTPKQKLLLKDLETTLQRVTNGFDMNQLYIYFDLDYDGETDKIWIVKPLKNYKIADPIGIFDYLMPNEYYNIQLHLNGYIQLFHFHTVVFDKKYDCILNATNKRKAKKHHDKYNRNSNNKIKNKSRKGKRIDTYKMEFFTEYTYYNAFYNANKPLHGKRHTNKHKRGNKHQYDTDNWWDYDKVFIFNDTQFYDPALFNIDCKHGMKYKMTLYPAPAVFKTFAESPGSAPYPYVIQQCIVNIDDEAYIHNVFSYLSDIEVHLTPREKLKYCTDNQETNRNYNTQYYTFSDVFCITKDGMESTVSTTGKVDGICPFTIGDVYVGNELKQYLQMDKISKFGVDLLSDQYIGNVHFASYGARTPWHIDLGLCTFIQVVYGEKNVKLWDVESSKKIEEYTNDASLDDKEKQKRIATIQPRWEIFLRRGSVLFMPSGVGHLVTTTSNTAIMATGSFLPKDQVCIGYEMAKYDAEYVKTQELNWDDIVMKATKDIKRNSTKMNIKNRLEYLVETGKQHNFN